MKPATSYGLFDSLARALRDRPDLQVKLTAHVRALSGHNTLFAFQMSDTAEETKIDVWQWCLGAVVNGCVPEPEPKSVRPIAANEWLAAYGTTPMTALGSL